VALPTYDAAKHHIGLKQSGGTSYGFMLDGGYVKEIQREKTSSSGSEFGGQTDLIGQAPSLSRWTQDDFIGGMFAYQWGRDDAMFADCMNMMPSQQARSLISCPPMFQKVAIDPDTQAGWTTDTPKSMFMVGGSIYVCWPHTLMRYQIDSGTTTWVAPATNCTFVNAEYESTDQVIWIVNNNSDAAIQPFMRRVKTDLTDPSWSISFPGPANTLTHVCYGGTIFNQFVVMQIGRKIYIGDPPDNPSPDNDGVMAWRKMGRLPGRWQDSLAWNNTLYILINDGSFTSRIYAFDGDTITPIVTFPFSFYAKCMIEYAGRIFVGGTGTDVNGGEHYAELYEVTGASTRLVRSFSPETRNYFLGGVAGEWPQQIDDLAVHEGLLWMCQKGKRMVAYDITSDSFYGAAEIQSNANLNFSKIIAGRGRLWAFGVDSGTDAGHGIYRIAQPADGVAAWNPTLITSDFAYEIASLKSWSEIQVLSRYGSVSSIEYSVNSGDSWTALTVANTSSGKVYFASAPLSAITPSKIIRFRIKLTSTGDAGVAATYHRELVAFTVSFSMTNETQKKAWGLTINGSEEIETRDALLDEGVTQTYLPSEIRSQLWTWANGQTPLTLRDLDGDDYTVKIEGFREIMPLVGPNATGDTEPEAQYALTLLEV